MNYAQRLKSISAADRRFFAVLALYCIVGAFLIDRYQYQISPDSTSYISLAQKYMAVDFKNAINGIWAPLYTWLLIPFIAIGIEPLLASVCLTVFFGLLTLVVVRSFLHKFELPEMISLAIIIALVPVLLSFALSDSPPDFLVVFFLMLYFNQLFDDKYSSNKWRGIMCGIYAALAYYSKAFALPFFLAHFVLWNGILYIRSRLGRKQLFRNFTYGVGAFLILTTPWITVISYKYQRVTFSTAGKFNYLAAGPESRSKGGPYYYKGLFPPPNKTAVSGWEDPTFHEMPHWSPFASVESLKYGIKLVRNNIRLALNKFQNFSTLSGLILFIYVLLALTPISRLLRKEKILFPLLSLAIYSAGYILIVVESRYLWINCILLLAMGGQLIKQLFETDIFTKIGKAGLLIAFAGTFMVPATRFLKTNLDTKQDAYLLGKKLAKEYHLAGNIATNKHHSTLYLAYHMKAKYFGQVRLGCSAAELRQELTSHDIDYYFVWGEAPESSTFLGQFREVTNGDFPGLRIYSLNEKI
ncbi:hypothetical protein MJD09_06215 [bacterium]|nr:hypothetical protein [bacterium]